MRADVPEWRAEDALHGTIVDAVDDMVLRRADGMWAYNLAVVVDDADQGVTEIVRGDDLLSSAPRQAYLAHLLGAPEPTYAHVPLVVNGEGRRLAKRDGDVTLRDVSAGEAQRWILDSLRAGGGAGGVVDHRDRLVGRRLADGRRVLGGQRRGRVLALSGALTLVGAEGGEEGDDDADQHHERHHRPSQRRTHA